MKLGVVHICNKASYGSSRSSGNAILVIKLVSLLGMVELLKAPTFWFDGYLQCRFANAQAA